jgi:hypothetical protein
MLKSQVLGSHCFKHNSWITMMVGVLPVPSRWAVLPPLVQQSTLPSILGHPLGSSICHHHQPFCILFIGISVIPFTKNPDQHLRKQPHPLACGVFSDVDILIDVINRNAICNDIIEDDIFLYAPKPNRPLAILRRVKNESLPRKASIL